MYLNQFTNTKNSVQALSLHVTNVYSGYMLGKNQKQTTTTKKPTTTKKTPPKQNLQIVFLLQK